MGFSPRLFGGKSGTQVELFAVPDRVPKRCGFQVAHTAGHPEEDILNLVEIGE